MDPDTERGPDCVNAPPSAIIKSVGRDPDILRDLVGAFEADTPDIGGKLIRVLLDHLDRAFFIKAINLDRIGRGNAVSLKKQHNRAYLALLIPGRLDLPDPLFADARYLRQLGRRLLDNVQRVLAELLDNPLRHDRPDALDHAGAEVFLDGGGGRRSHGFVALQLKLRSVLRVLDPLPKTAQAFGKSSEIFARN